VFCVQKGLTRAFHLSVEEFRNGFKDVNAKKLALVVNHPLGKLYIRFWQEEFGEDQGVIGDCCGAGGRKNVGRSPESRSVRAMAGSAVWVRWQGCFVRGPRLRAVGR
jgi:hypothetical protein